MRLTRLTSRSLALSFLLVPMLLFSASAAAQPDVARRDAEARFREGLTRVQSNDFEGARLAFVQAYSVLKSADVLWNLALSEMKSNHSLEALGHFKEYVKDARTTEPERVKARKYIEDLHGRVGRVAIEAPTGATLVVDGTVLAQQAPLSEPFDTTPGEHFVEARLGDRSRLLRVHAPVGGVVALQFRADDLVAGGGTTMAAAPATATSSGDPSAPPPTPAPASGEPPKDSTRYIVAGSLVGAGVVAGVAAIAFAFSSSSSADEADGILKGAPANACTGTTSAECTKLDDARQSEISSANWAVGLGVTSAVLVAGGVASFFLWPQKAQSGAMGSVGIAPMVGPTNGAMLRAAF